jgi:PAS domain S-box-containing protein
MVMAIARILIVEDETLIAKDLAGSLEFLGFEITETASTGEQALRIVEEFTPDLILMDIKLNGELDGIETAERILSRFDIPIVYLTAYTEEDVFERAKRTEPYGYIAKPFAEMDLRNTIEMALHKHVADRRVRESEHRLRSTWETLHDFVFVLNKDRMFVDYHRPPDSSKLYVPPEQFLGRHCKEVLPEDVADLLEEAIDSAVRTGLVQQFDYSMLIAGEQSWFNAKVSIRWGSSGGLDSVTIVCRDITERKKAEEALRRANGEWARTFDAVPDPIMILDTKHRIVRANKAMVVGLGLTPQQAIGMTCYEAVHGENAPTASCPHSKLLADGKEHSVEIEEPRLGGLFLVSVSPLHGEDGDLIGSVHVARKITGNRLTVPSRE